MEIAHSVHGVPIRLPSERWVHIVENHDDLAGKLYDILETIADPDYVLKGLSGELLALRRIKSNALVVVYREISSIDGFVITAFQTSKISQVIKTRKILWQKPNSKK